MAFIHQRQLFSWKDIENLGDLERLKLVIENMPDEDLMVLLERNRGKGRNRYPVRPIWNSILAGIVFQHGSVESLRRELQRNAQLRELCGFDVIQGELAVPTSYSYSRFMKNLLKCQKELDAIFSNLVNQAYEILPDFGKNLAIDSKAISSCAKKPSEKKADGRRDTDADFGKKTYRGRSDDGTVWEKIKSWFGYKLHLIVDADYELPIAFQVSKASKNDSVEAHSVLDGLETDQPKILKKCDCLMADKGYDDSKLLKRLWDKYEIKPIIDIRNSWKDKESKLLPNSTNVTYDHRGTVSCHCPMSGEVAKMAFGGFEKDRMTLKYICPAKSYGLTCPGQAKCPVKHSVRLDLNTDRRIFTPIARSSYKWETLYKKRTAVERVNSRLDVSFGFEHHYIRGIKKMKFRCAMSLCIMMSMALGRARQNRYDLMRSLVKAA